MTDLIVLILIAAVGPALWGSLVHWMVTRCWRRKAGVWPQPPANREPMFPDYQI